jgi:hypothetical protein
VRILFYQALKLVDQVPPLLVIDSFEEPIDPFTQSVCQHEKRFIPTIANETRTLLLEASDVKPPEARPEVFDVVRVRRLKNLDAKLFGEAIHQLVERGHFWLSRGECFSIVNSWTSLSFFVCLLSKNQHLH